MIKACFSKTRLVVLFLSFLLPHITSAQGVKPEHVYQVTKAVGAELAALNGENFTTASKAVKPNAPAMPRHVFFLARDQWRKVQLLRFMNGLVTHQLNDVSVRNVTPGEVKTLVDRLLIETQELRPAYGLGESNVSVPLVPDKKPTDVYESLKQVAAELKALGLPATVPNDVYKVALTVTQSMHKIAQKRGVKVDTSSLKDELGRTPADAYAASIELMQELKALTDQSQVFTVPGGISIPDAKSGAISPDDVIENLSRSLADIMAVMNTTGADSVLVYAPYIGGKTPSDVYTEIKRAHLIVAALRDN